MASLFIGMPVYNGERFIARALETLLSQSYRDWILLISDNDSQDNTALICKSYCEKDSRINYFKQSKNIGAINNFRYLLNKADTQYFMWAAADDEWNEKFIEACIFGMNSSSTDWAFTNIAN